MSTTDQREEHTMPTTEPGEVRIKVEDSKEFYVGATAVEAIRADANGQAHEYLSEAMRLWDDCDVEDIEEVKAVQFKLAQATACIDALVWLAPLEDDDDVA